MLNTDEASALANLIQNWEKTYKENPNYLKNKVVSKT